MSQQNNPYQSPRQAGESTDSGAAQRTSSWHQNQLIWVVWATYGAFYFCRTNISAAVAADPGIGTATAQGGLELSNDQIGWILAALKISYAVGQLVNGQLSERLRPRVLLAIGMFGSAGLNVLFGFSTGFYFLLFIWAMNGFCQSLGWTPCVRVVGNWIPVHRRGKAFGIIGTGYQITLGLTYLIAGQSAEYWGWRGAMFVPAGMMVAAGLFMLLFLKERPDEHSPPSQSPHDEPPSRGPKGSLLTNFLLTISNPSLWFLGLSLGLLNACRYGFLDWGLKHLTEVQQTGVGKAGLKYVVLACGAAVGSYAAGWATDRFFGSRRGPVICILLVTLGLLTVAYERIAPSSVVGTVALLFFIGFCIYGPQVLLVGTAPADLARRGTSAAAAGFVNFMGYLGAATGDRVTGMFAPEATAGMPPPAAEEWRLAIYIWAGWAFVAAVFAGVLWNATARARKEE